MSDHNIYPETKQPQVIERILKETHAPLILIISLISMNSLKSEKMLFVSYIMRFG